MAPRPRFTAVAVVDGKRFEILVPFDADGGIPRIITLGAKTHRTRLKKTSKKSQGKWIYREVKSA